MQDEESQQKGAVSLIYSINNRRHSDREVVWKMSIVASLLPARYGSFHFCYNSKIAKMLIALAFLVGGPETRARVRPHFGE